MRLDADIPLIRHMVTSVLDTKKLHKTASFLIIQTINDSLEFCYVLHKW